MDEIQEGPPHGSPFLRPSFVGAAVVVLVIVVLGVVVAVRAAGSESPAPIVDASPSAPLTVSPGSGSSVCGLAEGSQEIPALGPAAVWRYEGTLAYPTSQEFGPGKEVPKGYRFCFQHSPTGALFATANAIAHGSSADGAMVGAWAEYFVSPGSGRAKILAELSEPRSDSSSVRMSIVGFRILSYTGDAARVDIAVRTSGSSQTVLASAAYELVWEAGDWKLNSGAPQAFSFATVPNVDDYVQWGE